MHKEFSDHCERSHWDILPIEDVPADEKVLDCVWAMRRKRNILTKQVYKWKARLNLHGGQQEYGVNYYDTYSPVVNWFTCRLILIHALIHRWHTSQIDFVLAYPQADIENTLYMKFPYGIKTSKGSAKSHALKLKQNLYGKKQAGLVWYNHLSSRLKRIGFKQSAIDDYVFYKGNVIFFFYVDNDIFVSPESREVDKVIKELKDPAIGLDLEDQEDIANYLGIHFNYGKDGTITMSQPQLIDQIIEDVFKIKRNKNLPDIPVLSTCILQRDEKIPPFKGDFYYRSIIGK